MQANQYTASALSLKPQSTLTEMYIPLWVYSSGVVSTTTTTSGSALIQKSSTSTGNNSANSGKLHTLNSNWSPSQKFAFEASIYAANSLATVSAALYDFTSSSVVSGSQVSTTSTTATVLRSGQITLTPGHIYGVTIWTNNVNYAVYFDKAHLVAFLS